MTETQQNSEEKNPKSAENGENGEESSTTPESTKETREAGESPEAETETATNASAETMLAESDTLEGNKTPLEIIKTIIQNSEITDEQKSALLEAIQQKVGTESFDDLWLKNPDIDIEKLLTETPETTTETATTQPETTQGQSPEATSTQTTETAPPTTEQPTEQTQETAETEAEIQKKIITLSRILKNSTEKTKNACNRVSESGKGIISKYEQWRKEHPTSSSLLLTTGAVGSFLVSPMWTIGGLGALYTRKKILEKMGPEGKKGLLRGSLAKLKNLFENRNKTSLFTKIKRGVTGIDKRIKSKFGTGYSIAKKTAMGTLVAGGVGMAGVGLLPALGAGATAVGARELFKKK